MFSTTINTSRALPGPVAHSAPSKEGVQYGPLVLFWSADWRRQLADRHLLPFPCRRRWCPSASHCPVPFLSLLVTPAPTPQNAIPWAAHLWANYALVHEGGRTQVSKALHTRTSWHVHAAMCGSP